jgi:hypothetical protein
MPMKHPRGSRARGRRNVPSPPPPAASVANGGKGGSGLEDAATGKAARQPIISEALQTYLFLLIAGAVLFCLGVWGSWLALLSLRRGWFDQGEGVIIYAEQEPFWFYSGTFMLAGMTLGSAWLGAQMMWYARDEARLTARWFPASGRREGR